MSKRNVPGVRYNPRTGKWDYYFTAGTTDGGKRKQVTRRGFDTQREAQRARTAAVAEYHAGKRIDRSALTVGAFLTDQWLPGRVRLRPPPGRGTSPSSTGTLCPSWAPCGCKS